MNGSSVTFIALRPNATDSSNSTCSGLSGDPQWTSTSILTLFQFLLTFILNAGVLAVFAVRRALWSPFNVFLINLLAANTLYCLTCSVFDVHRAFFAQWCVGRALCNLNMYGMWVVTLVQMLSHPLIALNRLWALWLPISYHNHFSFATAFALTGLIWGLAHAVSLPGLLIDVLYYRQPEADAGCQVAYDASPGQKSCLIVIQFVSLLCLLIVLAAYPLIYHKERGRKKKVKPLRPTLTPVVETAFSSPDAVPVATPLPVPLRRKSEARRSNAFLLLTVLTASVFINWTVGVIYYFAQPFTGFTDSILDQVVVVTFTCQVIADPVLFALALKSLRAAISGLLCP